MTTTNAPTKLTATELARNLSDILNRIHYRGERFTVERNGEPIAELEPAQFNSAPTLAELAERMRHVPVPHDGFGDELAYIKANQPTARSIEWPS